MNISIRNENINDFQKVEELTREAFWNLHIPGCDEHYLVHLLRTHSDFIPYLNFVAVFNNEVIGNIMYTKSYVLNEPGKKIEIITFGPVCVLPKYQRQGVGSALINHSKKIAKEHNHKAIIIQGHPHNYCKHGFKCSKDFNVCDSEGKYPMGLLVLELEKGIFEGHKWKYYLSGVYDVDSTAAVEYDKQFKFKKKEYQYSQEEFSIAYRAYIE